MSRRRVNAIVLAATAAFSAMTAWGLREIAKSFDY